MSRNKAHSLARTQKGVHVFTIKFRLLFVTYLQKIFSVHADGNYSLGSLVNYYEKLR